MWLVCLFNQVWLILLNIMISNSIHFPVNVKFPSVCSQIKFYYVYMNNISLHMHLWMDICGSESSASSLSGCPDMVLEG